MIKTTEDKYVFFTTAGIGTLSKYVYSFNGLIVLSPTELFLTIFQAGFIAFVSGFLGIMGKHIFIWVKNKVFNTNDKLRD